MYDNDDPNSYHAKGITMRTVQLITTVGAPRMAEVRAALLFALGFR